LKKKLVLFVTLLLLATFGGTALATGSYAPKFAEPSNPKWHQFETKNNVPTDKVWTIDFRRSFSSEEISAITVQCDDLFVPVKVTQINDDKATVAPVENYLPGRKYCLKVFLENGKQYFMNFYPAAETAYSRLNPAPFYTVQEVKDDEDCFQTRITEFYRGEKAFDKLCDMFDYNINRPAPEGYEYILIKADTLYSRLSGDDDSKDLYPGNFKLYSQNYEEYSIYSPMTIPSANRYSTEVYSGGRADGYIDFLVKKTDKYPVIRYNPTYEDGIWFKCWSE
jgi:hypothetical protein